MAAYNRADTDTIACTRDVEKRVARLTRGLDLPGMGESRGTVSAVLTTALSAIIEDGALRGASAHAALGAAVACGIRLTILVTSDLSNPQSGVLAELQRLAADIERDADEARASRSLPSHSKLRGFLSA